MSALFKQKMMILISCLFFIICGQNLFGQSQVTIDKCAKELESTTPEIRQQAAMILGKYEEPMVTELLLAHLKDESNLVRRAVLVSLQDRIQKRMMGLTKMIDILDLLEDKDVEVRRLASTSAQFFIGILLRDSFSSASERSPAPITIAQQKKIKAKFRNSLQDSDDIVRLNNLTTISQNSHILYDPEFKIAVLMRIEDTNKSAVILALQLLKTQNNIDSKAVAEKLVDHEQPDVAIALIHYLEAKQYVDPAIWNKLSSRTNLDVSSKAIEVGFALGVKDMASKYSIFLLDNTNPVNQRIELIQNLRLHPKRKELLASLLDDKSNAIKLEAIKVAPILLEQPELMKLLKTFLSDSSASIKDESVNLMLQFVTNVDIDALKSLFSSDKETIRISVIDKVETLGVNNDDIILEAMMDDSKKVRLKAFDICGKTKRNNPKLKMMLTRSLEDADPDIKVAALQSISNYLMEAELLGVYKNFIETDDVSVKSYIAKQLMNLGNQEAQVLLAKLSQDKNISVTTQANLALFLRGDKSKIEILTKALLSKDIPLNERVYLQQVIAKEKDQVCKTFALLLFDPAVEIRLPCIKFFNFHRELYLEEYFNAVFTETDPTILNITYGIYQDKKFKNPEIIKKLVTSENQNQKMFGVKILSLNYDETLIPLLKELLQSKDLQLNFQALEVIKANNIKEFDSVIIEKLKGKAEKQIRMYLLFALLMLDSDTGNTYVKTIGETDELYPDLLKAQRNKKLEDSHPSKLGGKKR